MIHKIPVPQSLCRFLYNSDLILRHFSIYLILKAELGTGVCSAFNKNGYQKQKRSFWRIESGRRVRLTTSPSSVSQLSTQCGILNNSRTYRPQRPITGDSFTFILRRFDKRNLGGEADPSQNLYLHGTK
jgi:hypothetical protein